MVVWVVWASSRFEVNGTSAQAQLSRAVPRQTACPALLLQHGFGRSPVMWCGVAAGDALLHRHARAARWRRVVQNSRLGGQGSSGGLAVPSRARRSYLHGFCRPKVPPTACCDSRAGCGH